MFFFLMNKLSKVQKNIIMHEKAQECIARLVGRFSGKISATRKESKMYRSGLHPAMSVSRSVGRTVGRSPFYFLAFSSFLSLLLLSKCSGDLLQLCSCPSARDQGSRVSGLVSFLRQGKFCKYYSQSHLRFMLFLHGSSQTFGNGLKRKEIDHTFIF